MSRRERSSTDGKRTFSPPRIGPKPIPDGRPSSESMAAHSRLLICSDIHYACEAEKKRAHYEIRIIRNPLQRWLVRFYRHFIWLRDPFAHNALLEHVLQPAREPDYVIANGDF